MFDNIYSNLIKRVHYKTLIVIPIIVSVLMIGLLLVRPLPMGIDFKGGTLIDVATDSFSDEQLSSLESDLLGLGLADLKVYSGKDIETGKTKVSISTTSVVSLDQVGGILTKYFGRLSGLDSAKASLSGFVPSDLKKRLEDRFKINATYNNDTGVLLMEGMGINKADVQSALNAYLSRPAGNPVEVDLEKRNLNIDAVQPTLGEKLKNDGVKAAVIGYILMGLIIFLAFRNFIPSIAVLLSATCDAIITIGLMSIFNIVLEPASLVALIMLVGYSVDTDVLLTSRILKKKKGEIDEAVDSAIKTGLTMTGTTFVVMLVVVIVSATLTHLSALASIAAVLLLGLFADVMSTWFMNAGILKWYQEERGGQSLFFRKNRGRA
jgi:preprotein translocase subunit SecF